MTPHSGTPCAGQDFSSDFTLDAVNDVYDSIEEIARLSAIGYFKAASGASQTLGGEALWRFTDLCRVPAAPVRPR